MSFSDTLMSWFFGDESGINHEATDRSAQRIAGEIVRRSKAAGQSISNARTAFVDWYAEAVYSGEVTAEQFPVASEIAEKVENILRKGQK